MVVCTNAMRPEETRKVEKASVRRSFEDLFCLTW